MDGLEAHAEFVVDLSCHGASINRRLFGHNLEHTRSCVWSGLSAQLIRNRKFYGKSQLNGVALDWYAIQRGPALVHISIRLPVSPRAQFSVRDTVGAIAPNTANHRANHSTQG